MFQCQAGIMWICFWKVTHFDIGKSKHLHAHLCLCKCLIKCTNYFLKCNRFPLVHLQLCVYIPRWRQSHSTPGPAPTEGPVPAVRGWFHMSSKWNVSWRQTCYSHCGVEKEECVRNEVWDKKSVHDVKLQLSAAYKFCLKNQIWMRLILRKYVKQRGSFWPMTNPNTFICILKDVSICVNMTDPWPQSGSQ